MDYYLIPLEVGKHCKILFDQLLKHLSTFFSIYINLYICIFFLHCLESTDVNLNKDFNSSLLPFFSRSIFWFYKTFTNRLIIFLHCFNILTIVRRLIIFTDVLFFSAKLTFTIWGDIQSILLSLFMLYVYQIQLKKYSKKKETPVFPKVPPFYFLPFSWVLPF